MRRLALVSGASSLLSAPAQLVYDLCKGHFSAELIRSRLGLLNVPKSAAWFHASSVGECALAVAAASAINEAQLAADEDILSSALLTSWTNQGTVWARKRAAPQLNPGITVTAVDAVWNSPRAVRRLLQRTQPKAAFFVQSELWPSMISEASSFGCHLAVIDGRMSERSLRRWKYYASNVALDMMASFNVVIASSESHAARFKNLGATNVVVAPSLKFATAEEKTPQVDEELSAALESRKVWMAVSTHPGEAQVIIEAHRRVSQLFDKPPLLVLAPRYPEQCESIARSIDRNVMLRSKAGSPLPSTEVFIVDTLGELSIFFRHLDIAFIGNSLLANGKGHNFAEAAAEGCTILRGPNVADFEEMELQTGVPQSFIRVEDSASIAKAVHRLLLDPDSHREAGREIQDSVRRLGKQAKEAVVQNLVPLLN
ncbi:hypothetical protein NDN08_000937 [Rhodosorus marinus]|uniref:3-deoxy-D-manno-octulosonic-acid transferase N-terminal domain-containing protein n=1 Tax=Rhodosorus marinus TaxID=101924 RepID=A0AAV8UQY1_9RHOD|nr:hypothetical protein NDN08_000937 [Rhodosorus marinus]